MEDKNARIAEIESQTEKLEDEKNHRDAEELGNRVTEFLRSPLMQDLFAEIDRGDWGVDGVALEKWK